ncbi:MAG: hypothetical protein BGO76_08095 [Caedibacter sp. 38-128]|nr:ETC complex I subunit [Holosporales bacterium]OJX03270.1 MAG: hypothetical protein BGO76_08095 [Caedibacter sp. 38-128]
MSDVRIYKPTKTAMQSGVGRTKIWVLEFIQPAQLYVEPLMKWTGSVKTNSVQPKLFFESCEKAIEYAKSKNLSYLVDEARPLKMRFKRYSDNFIDSKKL